MVIGFSVQLKGSEKMRNIYESVGRGTFMHAVGQAVYVEANSVMRKAKAQVPLDDGPLRASGVVEPVQVSGSRWEVRLGFGGAASAYALIQHENMSFHHDPGRKAHYLSDPIREALPSMEARLARVVAAYFTPTDFGGASAAAASHVAESNATAAANVASSNGGTE